MIVGITFGFWETLVYHLGYYERQEKEEKEMASIDNHLAEAVQQHKQKHIAEDNESRQRIIAVAKQILNVDLEDPGTGKYVYLLKNIRLQNSGSVFRKDCLEASVRVYNTWVGEPIIRSWEDIVRIMDRYPSAFRKKKWWQFWR